MCAQNFEAIYPLAASQQGMLLETLGAPPGTPGIHVEQSMFELHGELDTARFHQAWRSVVQRHAILRTAFSWGDKQAEPVQVALRDADLAMTVEDWRSSSAPGAVGDQAQRLEAFLEADRKLGFALKRAPLLRLALLRTADRTHRFVFSFHHIILDGWSLSLILGEAMAIYEALVHGREPSLPAPLPYRAYVSWVRERAPGPAQAYWQGYLRGFTRATALGREQPCEADREDGYGELLVEVDEAVGRAIAARARRHRVTPGLVFQGVWGLLLARYSGDRDVVFGTTVSGRPADLPGALSAVGLFINTVPMRLATPAGAPLWSWLADVQAAQATGREHEHCSTGQIYRWRDSAATGPLCDSLIVFENYPEAKALDDATVRVDPLESRTVGARTSFPVTVLVGSRAGYWLKMVYQRRRVDDAAAAAILRHFQLLLARIAAEPESSLGAPLGALIDHVPAGEIPTVHSQRAALVGEVRHWVGPRDVTELKLATLWQEVLECESVGVFDNFFDLGGHSLLALDLMARMESAFGVRLPMSALLQHPTVEAVARQLRDGGGDAGPWSPLVPIRTTGLGAPLFCVPGAAIDAISLHPLAHAFGDDHPFFGIQPRGLDGRLEPHRSVEAMAAAVVEVMRATQPRGPYYLGGHSFGTHVAFEASQQLAEAGCEVALLALLDAEASTVGQGPSVPARGDTDRLTRLLSLVHRFFGREISLPLDAANLPADDLIEHVARKLADARILPAGLGAERVKAYLAVGEATSLAYDAYRPVCRHPVDTLLFRARQTHRDDAILGAGVPGDESMGWERLTGREVTVRWVPGDHVTMMTRPNVDVLAGILRDAMRRDAAQARRRRPVMEVTHELR
jgi:thioesterase domain-containing protein/acyl carrier protein